MESEVIYKIVVSTETDSCTAEADSTMEAFKIFEKLRKSYDTQFVCIFCEGVDLTENIIAMAKKRNW